MKSLSIGGLVLAGGLNTRMQGKPKALLTIEGETFLSRLELALSMCKEKLLSTNTPELAKGTSFLVVPDLVTGQGPLGGLYSALSVCESDALLICACDMPFFSQAAALFFTEQIRAFPTASAVAFTDPKGRLHPLCGVYKKNCVSQLEDAFTQGNRSVTAFFKQIGGIEIPIEAAKLPPDTLTNVNTPDVSYF